MPSRLVSVLILLSAVLAGCNLDIEVPEGGKVVTDSGEYECAAGASCRIKVSDTRFDETFTAVPEPGFVFDGWARGDRRFCGGKDEPCRLFTTTFGDNATLLGFLEADDVFVLEPVFRAVETFRLRGTISVSAAAFVDGDVNDPIAPYIVNDAPAVAQRIPNPVTIGGYANLEGVGDPGPSTDFGDLADFYDVDLREGQVMNLVIAEPISGDLDLVLLDEAGEILDFSVETGFLEQLIAPFTGRFSVGVVVFEGASNYTLSVGQQAQSQQILNMNGRADLVHDEAIVAYRPPVSTASVQAAVAPQLEQLGSRATTTASASARYPQQLPGKFASAQLEQTFDTLMKIKALAKNPAVAYAEPNSRHQAFQLQPSDPLYSLQQHYEQIGLPTAWQLTTGSPDVVVAVVDTGVLLDHPDMQGKTEDGYDFIRSPGTARDGDGIDDNPDDPGDGSFFQSSSFHGTHVAGTVGAATNNGVGGAGVSWGSPIMPIRVLGEGGGTTYDIMQGIRYAAGLANDSGRRPGRPADIINLSLGGPGRSQAMQNTINAVRNRGVIVVAASGNEGSSVPSYPAAYDGVVSVGAVGPTGTITNYSNFGPSLDLVAPGGDQRFDNDGDGFGDGVLSASADDSSGSAEFSWVFNQGTSMAAPHVAGVFALMKSVSPDLSPSDIDRLLQEGKLTRDLGAPGRDNSYGYGVLDANRAVTAARDLDNPGQQLPPQLSVFPASLTVTAGRGEFTISNAGDGNLRVNDISTSVNWLSVAPLSVSESGVGSYIVRVNSSPLPPGVYNGNILITSNAGTVRVNVTATLAELEFVPSTGVVYALLLDTDGEVVEQQVLFTENSRYRFDFPSVPQGEYFLLVGSDMDNDLFICDAGEACGAYLTAALPQLLVMNRDRNQISFDIAFEASFNSEPAATASGLPPRYLQQRRGKAKRPVGRAIRRR